MGLCSHGGFGRCGFDHDNRVFAQSPARSIAQQGTSSVIRLAVMSAVLAAPAMAEVKPAPQYFVDALFASTAAQQVALFCPSLSIEPIAAQNQSETILAKLDQDGFDTTQEDLGMADISDTVAGLSTAFMARHGLDGVGADKVCDAGRAEIADASYIGALLIEAAQ